MDSFLQQEFLDAHAISDSISGTAIWNGDFGFVCIGLKEIPEFKVKGLLI